MKNKELEQIIEDEFDCLINDLTCLIGEEWIAESIKEVVNKAFALGVVSNRRELLIDFCSKVEETLEMYGHLAPNEAYIDEYLKGN
jgi:hypothetical protein